MNQMHASVSCESLIFMLAVRHYLQHRGTYLNLNTSAVSRKMWAINCIKQGLLFFNENLKDYNLLYSV